MTSPPQHPKRASRTDGSQSADHLVGRGPRLRRECLPSPRLMLEPEIAFTLPCHARSTNRRFRRRRTARRRQERAAVARSSRPSARPRDNAPRRIVVTDLDAGGIFLAVNLASAIHRSCSPPSTSSRGSPRTRLRMNCVIERCERDAVTRPVRNAYSRTVRRRVVNM